MPLSPEQKQLAEKWFKFACDYARKHYGPDEEFQGCAVDGLMKFAVKCDPAARESTQRGYLAVIINRECGMLIRSRNRRPVAVSHDLVSVTAVCDTHDIDVQDSLLHMHQRTRGIVGDLILGYTPTEIRARRGLACSTYYDALRNCREKMCVA